MASPALERQRRLRRLRKLFDGRCSPSLVGDLGSVWAAEKKLEVIFRLADLWDCILLLDEADVLLSARTPTDNFERNGLVSGKQALEMQAVTGKKKLTW